MGVDMHAVGVRATVPAPDDREAWYFRLNWRGMSAMLEEMASADVLDAETPEPRWMEYPGDAHLRELDEFDEFGSEYQPLDAIGREYCEQLRAARYQLGEHGKVPLYKFGSNDGWVVTPVECLWVADALDERVALLDGPWQELVEEYIAFNRRCAEGAGGYGVH